MHHDHSHTHAHGHVHEHDATQGHLKFSILLNLIFAIIELVIGFVSNSIAILTDSVHDFADSGSLFIALIAAKISERPSDEQKSFGYRRVSILAALLNSGILLGSTVFIFYHAIARLFQPQEIESSYMFLIAGLSIIVNGAAVLRMRKDRKTNLNLEGAFWHLMEDALGGIGLLVGGVIIRYTGWYWVDSVLSLVIGSIILQGSLRIVLQSIHIFLEGVPEDVDFAEIKEILLSHPEVEDVHHLHIWMLDTNHYNMSVHLKLETAEIPPNLYGRLQEELEQFKISHLTVQVEGPEAECLPCQT